MSSVLSLFDLKGRCALVTGGAGHLGTAISEALYEAGANVAIASRDQSRCQDLASQLGPGNLGLFLDIESELSIQNVVQDAFRKLGRLDILINCAYSGPSPVIDQATAADFEKALRLTITAVFVASQQAARLMLANGGGSIIQVGSIYGSVGSYPDQYQDSHTNSSPTYHAGKGGIVQLTRYLAVYWAKHRIRVNALSPGPFPHSAKVDEHPRFYERLAGRVPMGRVGEPWEIKGAALYLASDASSYVTGQNLLVDGGWTAW